MSQAFEIKKVISVPASDVMKVVLEFMVESEYSTPANPLRVLDTNRMVLEIAQLRMQIAEMKDAEENRQLEAMEEYGDE